MLFPFPIIRRIEEMSDDIADQILAEIKEIKLGFAIQLNESTDITNYLFMSVMRGRNNENRITTESRSFYTYEWEGYF